MAMVCDWGCRRGPGSDGPTRASTDILIPSRVAYHNPLDFTDLTFYHSEHGVLVEPPRPPLSDETIGDHISTLAVLDQPEARALLVTDQRVHDQWMMASYVRGSSRWTSSSSRTSAGHALRSPIDIDRFEDPSPRSGVMPGRRLATR